MATKEAAERWVARQRVLLEKEKDAEVEQNKALYETFSPKALQNMGVSLLRLYVLGVSSGLGGRTLLELETGVSRDNGRLPSNRMSSGDLVRVTPAASKAEIAAANAAATGSRVRGKKAGGGKEAGSDGDGDGSVTGIVARVTDAVLTVALDDLGDQSDALLGQGAYVRVDLLANDVTYRRYGNVLDHLPGYSGIADGVMDVAFGSASPTYYHEGVAQDKLPLLSALDASQEQAVRHALAAQQVAVIHGPPGSGKTTTLVELIRQAVKLGRRVLVCAASNIAVDNIVERLAGHKETATRMVRMGHPARVMPSVLQHCLDYAVQQHDGSALAKDIRKEIGDQLALLSKSRNGAERRAARAELRTLNRELKVKERETVARVLKEARVVLCTCTGASPGKLKEQAFDMVVIDEAAQALEVACWIPLLFGRVAVLAGDHHQLPPLVKASSAERELSQTLFARLIKQHPSVSVMLTVQYRMHQDIMAFSSSEFYGGRMTAHESVASITLPGLANVQDNEDTQPTIILVDTAGCSVNEAEVEDGDSKLNEGEAKIVAAHVAALAKSGVCDQDMAVITPYNGQVAVLKSLLREAHPRLEIGSVDGFQGREKEVIILSLVRSNDEHEIGFLRDDRRTNVAITRAKRQLVVIGDSETVTTHKFLDRFIGYCGEHGDYRDATQYLDM